MARRLPIYLLLDVSESMAGKEIASLTSAVQGIVASLRKNPYALETVWISVIGFAGKAKVLTPLQELVSFVPPELPVGGGTSLGVGLNQLMDSLSKDLKRGSAEQKGDWKPVVFLLTDGRPTDNPDDAIRQWNARWRSAANLVAVSIGGQADLSYLRKMTEDVVNFQDTAPDAFAKFAQWISSSVSTQSQNALSGQGDKVQLAKLDGHALQEIGESMTSNSGSADERYAVFVGKCSKSKVPYLLKFELTESSPKYQINSAVKLENTYFDLCDASSVANAVSTGDLGGMVPCPHCGNGSPFSVCQCGKLNCTSDEPSTITCGWCGVEGYYTPIVDPLRVNRGKG